jgi:hypothetical protein
MKNIFMVILFIFFTSSFALSLDYQIGIKNELLTLPDDIILIPQGQEDEYFYFTYKNIPQILIQINTKENNYNEEEIINNLKDKMKLYDTVLSKDNKTLFIEYTVIPNAKNRNQDNENSMVLLMWDIYKNNRYYLLTFLLKYKDFLESSQEELKTFGRTIIKGIKNIE